MRILFFLSVLLNLAMTGLTYALGPERLAVHFGSGGQPDNWDSAGMYVVFITGIHLLIFATFYFTPHLTRIAPRSLINLPNKAYWLSPENRSLMETFVTSLMMQYGTVTFAFMFALGAMVLKANLSEPVRFRSELFWCFLAGYFGYTVYWCIQCYRKFRIPAESSESQVEIN